MMPNLVDGRCVYSDLRPSECAHCTGIEQRARQERERFASGWISAQYAGGCWDCDERISVGDHIRRSADGLGWVGECCAE